MANFCLWFLGSVVLPLAPLGAIRAAGWFMNRPITLEDLIGDGVLFFYNTSLSGLVLIDIWRDSLLGRASRLTAPPFAQGAKGVIVAAAVVMLILNAVCYTTLVLIRIGKLEGSRARELMGMSWQFMFVVVTFVTVFRFFSRIY